MASSTKWSSIDDSEYDAAEIMVQHSRSARSNATLNGYTVTETQPYTLAAIQSQPQTNSMSNVSLPPYSNFQPPYQSIGTRDQAQGFDVSFDGKLPPPHAVPGSSEHHGRDSFSDMPQSATSDASGKDQNSNVLSQNGRPQQGNGGIDDSEPTSPISTRDFSRHNIDESEPWAQRSNQGAGVQQDIKGETEQKPAWSELKTKAGKERKRLPLACIACRRKKIRCSGEKPSCKHCMRSRIPCVYKVTQRKAAPRTDYMAMLDKRLKRMEERVIKIIPKDEMAGPSAVPRAIIKPPPPAPANGGKKRAAEEAFGVESRTEEWAPPKLDPSLFKGKDGAESRINTEGEEFLPPAEIQEHLSEVFFDYLYGQSYHLLHKPSYMRRLKYIFRTSLLIGSQRLIC